MYCVAQIQPIPLYTNKTAYQSVPVDIEIHVPTYTLNKQLTQMFP